MQLVKTSAAYTNKNLGRRWTKAPRPAWPWFVHDLSMSHHLNLLWCQLNSIKQCQINSFLTFKLETNSTVEPAPSAIKICTYCVFLTRKLQHVEFKIQKAVPLYFLQLRVTKLPMNVVYVKTYHHRGGKYQYPRHRMSELQRLAKSVATALQVIQF